MSDADMHADSVRKRQDKRLLKAVAARLNALLLAKGLKDAEMARRLKCKPQTWNNYTQGERPLPVSLALEIVSQFGVSLDWIYRGEASAMPHGLLMAIEQHYKSGLGAHLN